MNPQTIRDIMSGRQRGIAADALRAALCIAEKPYAAAMRIRRWAYRKNFVRSRRAAAPVISIGNITAGGTGKTPMVAFIAGQLLALGRRPAVVMRGYKSIAGKSDEAQMLKQLIKAESEKLKAEIPFAEAIYVNPDRVAGARQAVAGGADVIILDDAFQHLRIRRDLDIVLIDATNPLGFGHCLPRGLLREPPAALADAGAIVITRSDQVSAGQLQQLRQYIYSLAPHSSIHIAVHRPAAVIDENGNALPPSALAGRAVYAFCGIGNPDSFLSQLRMLGANVKGQSVFGDHCEYSDATLAEIFARARAAADCLITTQKDFVKIEGLIKAISGLSSREDVSHAEPSPSARNLHALHLHPLPILQLAIEIQITDGLESLLEKLKVRITK